jgi:hypothetical protein
VNVREALTIPISECAGLERAELAVEPPHYSCDKEFTTNLLVVGYDFGRVCIGPTNTGEYMYYTV